MKHLYDLIDEDFEKSWYVYAHQYAPSRLIGTVLAPGGAYEYIKYLPGAGVNYQVRNGAIYEGDQVLMVPAAPTVLIVNEMWDALTVVEDIAVGGVVCKTHHRFVDTMGKILVGDWSWTSPGNPANRRLSPGAQVVGVTNTFLQNWVSIDLGMMSDYQLKILFGAEFERPPTFDATLVFVKEYGDPTVYASWYWDITYVVGGDEYAMAGHSATISDIFTDILAFLG